MPTIHIHRPKQFADRFRKYRILIDDVEVGLISAGDSIELQTPEDSQFIQCKIDWCSSNTVSIQGAVKAGEITIMHTKKQESIWARILPLGKVTIGKDNYLTLLLGHKVHN